MGFLPAKRITSPPAAAAVHTESPEDRQQPDWWSERPARPEAPAAPTEALELPEPEADPRMQPSSRPARKLIELKD